MLLKPPAACLVLQGRDENTYVNRERYSKRPVSRSLVSSLSF